MSDATQATPEQRIAALEGHVAILHGVVNMLVSLLACDVVGGTIGHTDSSKDTPARAFVRVFVQHFANTQRVSLLEYAREEIVHQDTPHMALLHQVLDQVIARSDAQLKKFDAEVIAAAKAAGLPTEAEST